MGHRERQLARIEENPIGVRFSQLMSLLESYGFSVKPPRGGGSHYKITHDEIPGRLTIPKHDPVAPPYVREALTWIHLVNDSEEEG